MLYQFPQRLHLERGAAKCPTFRILCQFFFSFCFFVIRNFSGIFLLRVKSLVVNHRALIWHLLFMLFRFFPSDTLHGGVHNKGAHTHTHTQRQARSGKKSQRGRNTSLDNTLWRRWQMGHCLTVEGGGLREEYLICRLNDWIGLFPISFTWLLMAVCCARHSMYNAEISNFMRSS